MNTIASTPHRVLPPNATERMFDGWRLIEFEQVDSTNLVAAPLASWHAVRANTQTAGRGRFQRSWVSDRGGLWLSAVVPAGERQARELLPLASGLAVIEALREFGIDGIRLRWPNDIMIGERKLAGLLVDSFDPTRAVVGIGVNISNQPAVHDSTLTSTAVRLADLLSEVPGPREVTEAILKSLRGIVNLLHHGGMTELCPRINLMWDFQRQVKLDLDGVEETGWFCGVDEYGRLLLRDNIRHIKTFEPHQVKLLREIGGVGHPG